MRYAVHPQVPIHCTVGHAQNPYGTKEILAFPMSSPALCNSVARVSSTQHTHGRKAAENPTTDGLVDVCQRLRGFWPSHACGEAMRPTIAQQLRYCHRRSTAVARPTVVSWTHGTVVLFTVLRCSWCSYGRVHLTAAQDRPIPSVLVQRGCARVQKKADICMTASDFSVKGSARRLFLSGTTLGIW